MRPTKLIATVGLVSLVLLLGACTDSAGQEGKKDRPDVVFVPTPQAVVDKMLELAKVSEKDIVFDLGCGNGIIVCTAAKKYKCKAYGFDVDDDRIKESNARVKEMKVGDLVKIQQKNIFKLDFTKDPRPTVITLYLLPSLNVKLIPQLDQLPKGVRIVSHDFDMEGVTPDRKVTVQGPNRDHTVYLWTTPLKKEKKSD